MNGGPGRPGVERCRVVSYVDGCGGGEKRTVSETPQDLELTELGHDCG